MTSLSFDDLPDSASVDRAPLRITINPSYGNAISSIESGGQYGAVGPITKRGDRAFGKYQVMGANIPQWTREALGRELTPREYLANPEAQDAVFQHRFGGYVNKYGPEGAARAWFAGEGGMNNPNAADVNGMTVARYAEKFNNAIVQREQSPAMANAYDGEGVGNQGNYTGDVKSTVKVAPVERGPLSQVQAPQALSFDDIPNEKASFNERFGNIEQKAVDQGAMHAFARGVGQGATFGFGDELRGMQVAGGGDARGMDDPSAILKGLYHYWTGDKTAERNYTDARRQADMETKIAESQHPIASTAGNVIGGTIATIPAGGFGAPAAGAGIAGRALQGAKTGAAFGAAYGLGEGEGTDRIKNAAIGAGTGAVAGAAVNAALGKRPVGQIEPKASEMFAASKPYYREWTSGASKIEVPDETAAGIADRLRGALDSKNLTPDLAGQVYKSIEILDRGKMTLDGLQNVKRVIGRSFNSPDKNIRDAASIASGELSKVIREISPQAAESLATADAIHSTATAMQNLQRKADVADLRAGRAGYGGNAVNSMRQVLSPIVQRATEGKTTGFKPNEIQAMRDIVEGTPITNSLRTAGQLSPSKGIMQTALAGGAYMATGPGGFVIPAIGAASNKLATFLTGKQIEQLSKMVAKRSPAYADAVAKATEKYIAEQAKFASNPTPALFASYLSASRALSSGLNRDGISITSGDLIKAIQGPMYGRADGEQPQPDWVGNQ